MSSRTTQNVNTIVSTIISVSVNIIVIAAVIMCIYFLANWSYNFGNAIFDSSPVDAYNGKNVIVTVPQNAKLLDVSRLMKDAGVIKDEYVFMIQIILSDEKDNIVPGTYTLSTSMMPTEIIEIIASDPEAEE